MGAFASKSMGWYDVVIVQPRQWGDYVAYHRHGITKRADGSDIATADLAVTEMVQARNKGHAVEQMRNKHPGCTIDAEATAKSG